MDSRRRVVVVIGAFALAFGARVAGAQCQSDRFIYCARAVRGGL